MDDIHYKYVGVKLQVVISFPDIIIGVKTEYMDLDYMGSFLWPASWINNVLVLNSKYIKHASFSWPRVTSKFSQPIPSPRLMVIAI